MITTRQQTIEEALQKDFDAIICASGFESRSSFLAEKLSGKSRLKFALGFASEQADAIRIENDRRFKENGFDLKVLPEDCKEDEFLQGIMDFIFKSITNGNEVRICIDYSSMTKNWYSYLLYSISQFAVYMPITVVFCYSHAFYVKHNGSDVLNKIIGPLDGYCNLSIPHKPTALVASIGNEPNRAYGFKEYFDATPYVFYTDLSYNSEYSIEIEQLHERFLSDIKPDNVFKYPATDLMYTSFLIENLCSVLLKDFRVIIAPCGSKPFALLAMIASLRFNGEIEVWRISPGAGISKINRVATGIVNTLEVQFSNAV